MMKWGMGNGEAPGWVSEVERRKFVPLKHGARNCVLCVDMRWCINKLNWWEWKNPFETRSQIFRVRSSFSWLFRCGKSVTGSYRDTFLWTITSLDILSRFIFKMIKLSRMEIFLRLKADSRHVCADLIDCILVMEFDSWQTTSLDRFCEIFLTQFEPLLFENHLRRQSKSFVSLYVSNTISSLFWNVYLHNFSACTCAEQKVTLTCRPLYALSQCTNRKTKQS